MSRITIIIGVLFLTMFNLVGCSETNDIENMVSEYTKSCNKADYESMYELLSKESKEYISRDEFIERYTKIYSGIGVNNFKIEIGEIKDKSKIPTVTSMNTIAGNLKFEDTELMISKEGKEYKVIWDESLILPQMIKNDKVSFKTTNGSRGKILDRDNNMLSYDGYINSVLVNPKIFKETESITNMAQILDIDEAYIQKKLSDNTNPEHLVSIVKIANNEKEKVMLVDEINGVEVRKETSRVYMQGEAFGNLIGYTGDISKEELDKNQGKVYTSSSKIGKKGLEEIYEEKLKSTNGVHIYIQRDDEEITIAKTEPKNGEVLAMVSSPSYDSNNLVAYKTKTIAKKYEEKWKCRIL